jgi:hypothetical protein
MAYVVQTIGALDDGSAPAPSEASPMTKLAIVGVVAGAGLFLSPEYQKLQPMQKLGLAVGVVGLFIGVMQLAMQKQTTRQMQSFKRGPDINPDDIPVT